MSIDRAVLTFAGTMVLVSLALSRFVHSGFVWLKAFVDINLIQSSIAGFCPAAMLFRKVCVKSGAAFCAKVIQPCDRHDALHHRRHFCPVFPTQCGPCQAARR